MLTSTKKKMSITRIRTNSHQLRSETGRWSTSKTPSEDRICQICDTKKVEDENQFLLDCMTITHIRSQFPIISHTSNLLDLLSQPNYSDLEMLIPLLFDHRNKILKNDS